MKKHRLVDILMGIMFVGYALLVSMFIVLMLLIAFNLV